MAASHPTSEAQVFRTKAWGFSPETHPTFGFSLEGARSEFLREAAPGDFIVVAGTKDEPTRPEEQGRILGIVKVGHEKVDADSILKALGTPLDPVELNDDGSYKWPWAMPKAWVEQDTTSVDAADVGQVAEA